MYRGGLGALGQQALSTSRLPNTAQAILQTAASPTRGSLHSFTAGRLPQMVKQASRLGPRTRLSARCMLAAACISARLEGRRSSCF